MSEVMTQERQVEQILDNVYPIPVKGILEDRIDNNGNREALRADILKLLNTRFHPFIQTLEWEQLSPKIWKARTAFGVYQIDMSGGEYFLLKLGTYEYGGKTLEEAKQKSFFEQRRKLHFKRIELMSFLKTMNVLITQEGD